MVSQPQQPIAGCGFLVIHRHKLKVQVIAENITTTEEFQGLKLMFMDMDTDKSGTITYHLRVT